MVSSYRDVPINALNLPPCPLPRPGDRVTWFSGAVRRFGTLVGHRSDGRPSLISDQGAPVAKCTFDEIRVADPLNRVGPNWMHLDGKARIVKPPEVQLQRFKILLEQRTPPGPMYVDLITEIWSRGFEVFLVGGTVRDVIAGIPSNDVDLVTTMPLQLLRPLARSMYRHNPSPNPQRGYIRIGGPPESGDPFIDVKVFGPSGF